MRIDQVAMELIAIAEDRLEGVPLRDPYYDGKSNGSLGCEAINPEAARPLAETILDLIANVVAIAIDAGSASRPRLERDAVNESMGPMDNEELLAAISDELLGWTLEGKATT